jgi:hypothetical protein
MSNAEYQRNSDLGFVIRTTLAMAGCSVYEGRQVTGVQRYGNNLDIYLAKSGRLVRAERVIVATGLGRPTEAGLNVPVNRGKRILDFNQFMSRFDGRFPLKGFGRVAVIGSGDSGKTVVEALTGQGPLGHLSTAAMDWPDTIDWYGENMRDITCEQWEERVRTRYKRLGRFFRGVAGPKAARVKGRGVARQVATGADCAYVDERRYDYVIMCTGFASDAAKLAVGNEFEMGGRRIGRRQGEKYVVGPAAALSLTTIEEEATDAYRQAPENKTALFRLADRTAALAAALPAVKRTLEEPPKPPRRKLPKAQPKVAAITSRTTKIEVRKDYYDWVLYQNGKRMAGERGYAIKENAEGRARWIFNGRKAKERDYS